MDEPPDPCPTCADGRQRVARLERRVTRERRRREDAETLAERYTRDALHDPLTALANRTLLLDRLGLALSRARRASDRVGLLFLDLDDFKPVNDTFGHAAGDRLLTVTAERLRDLVSPGDTVARLGGDEFVILAESAGDAEALGRLAGRVAASLTEPCVLDGRAVTIQVSCGGRLAEAHEQPEAVLRDADAAMYAAKNAGKGRFVLFDDTTQSQRAQRLRCEADLRRGLVAGELIAWYQPVVDLRTGGVSGAEALARWAHPERGLVPPQEFISQAEELGLIGQLTDRMLQSACAQLAQWNAGASQARRLSMHVNVSGLELADDDLVARVESALAVNAVDPRQLCLEITERSLVSQDATVQRNLAALRLNGVSFAVDDFGVEYASFSYLRRFPVDILKIDRSFVEGAGRDARDDAVLAGIVAMARALSMRTVAEGVETACQVDALQRIGVDEVQGWFFAPAAPAAQWAHDVERIAALHVAHGVALPAQRAGQAGVGRR